MAIDNRTLLQITADTANPTTTEHEFRIGITDVAEEVNQLNEYMDQTRSLSIEGDMTGTVSWNNYSDADADVNLVMDVQLDMNAITGADIADDSIDSRHYVDRSIDSIHIATNQILTEHIAPSARQRFRVLDQNSNALLDVDVLVRQG